MYYISVFGKSKVDFSRWDVMWVRRMGLLVLLLVFLALPARAANTGGVVALTFDDGPSGRYTRRLLDGLDSRGVKATFLLCGYRLRDYPETGQAIFDRGHEIGLHGFTHKSMKDMSAGEVEKELRDTVMLLPKGCTPIFMRPPGGLTTRAVCRAAENVGVAVLNWSLDPKDWARHDAAAVEQAVVRFVQDGDVVLLHDMTNSSVDAALAIVDDLQSKGFRFVTVSELAALRGVEPQPGKEYTRF